MTETLDDTIIIRVDELELQRLRKVEAILCAICSRFQSIVDVSALDTSNKDAIFDSALLSGVDWQEAGVTKEEAQIWWNVHKEMARRRREQEELERENAMKREEALSKLTPEERVLLGITE